MVVPSLFIAIEMPRTIFHFRHVYFKTCSSLFPRQASFQVLPTVGSEAGSPDLVVKGHFALHCIFFLDPFIPRFFSCFPPVLHPFAFAQVNNPR